MVKKLPSGGSVQCLPHRPTFAGRQEQVECCAMMKYTCNMPQGPCANQIYQTLERRRVPARIHHKKAAEDVQLIQARALLQGSSQLAEQHGVCGCSM